MIERLKTLAIVALSLSLAGLLAVALTLGAWGGDSTLLNFIADISQGGAAQPIGTDDARAQTAALPSRMALLGDYGVYSPASPADYTRIYDAVAGIYSEALGSSRAERTVTAEEYMALFEAPAIYLAFDSALPLWLHHSWTDSVDEKSDRMVDSLVLSRRGDTVVLAFSDGAGRYYMMDTGTNPTKLSNACAGNYTANCAFAFDCGMAALRSDEIIYTGYVPMASYSLSVPSYAEAGEAPRAVLESFGIRPYLAAFFVSASGAIQYVDQTAELTVEPDGALTFVNIMAEESIFEGTEKGSRSEAAQAVEYVRAVVTSVWKSTDSFGVLSLDYVDYDSDSDCYYIGFEAMVGGVYIQTQGRPAYAVIKGGRAEAIRITPFSGAESGGIAIPYAQYAAAAGPADGRFGFVYSGTWPGEITPAVGVYEGR